jgi:hypothetical protein
MHLITPFLLAGAGVCIYLVVIYAKFIVSDTKAPGHEHEDVLTKFFSAKLYMDIGVKDAPITSWGPINQAIAAVTFLYLAVALEMNMLSPMMKLIKIVVLLYLAGALFYEYNTMSKFWTPDLESKITKIRDLLNADQKKFGLDFSSFVNYYSSILAWLDYDGPSSLAVGLLCLATAGYLGAYEKLKGLVLKSKRR